MEATTPALTPAPARRYPVRGVCATLATAQAARAPFAPMSASGVAVGPPDGRLTVCEGVGGRPQQPEGKPARFAPRLRLRGRSGSADGPRPRPLRAARPGAPRDVARQPLNGSPGQRGARPAGRTRLRGPSAPTRSRPPALAPVEIGVALSLGPGESRKGHDRPVKLAVLVAVAEADSVRDESEQKREQAHEVTPFVGPGPWANGGVAGRVHMVGPKVPTRDRFGAVPFPNYIGVSRVRSTDPKKPACPRAHPTPEVSFPCHLTCSRST